MSETATLASHLAPLSGDWALWRDVALRSAGFDVAGLDVFGGRDEADQLRSLACNAAFAEAMTWQNRPAVHNALRKLGDATAKPSKLRQREELVASYWQRYCAKNDTIGFFGPLAWATVADGGPGITITGRGEIAARTVALEHWGVQAFAHTIDDALDVPLIGDPADELRQQLARHPDPDVRGRGLDGLDALERARASVERAPASDLESALAELDRTFVTLTAAAPERDPGATYAARTLAYLDCMTDLSVAIGPLITDELAESLPAVLASGRWYCGRVFDRAQALIRDAIADHRNGPLRAPFRDVMGVVPRLDAAAREVTRELQDRWSALLEVRDEPTLVSRAVAAFADARPAWRWSVYQSVDIQIAAASVDAANRGDFTCVVADVHPGANPLAQAVFGARHPDRAQFLEAWASDVGSPQVVLVPSPARGMTSRLMGCVTRRGDLHVLGAPGAAVPAGYRRVPVDELFIEDENITDQGCTFSAPITDLLAIPMMRAAVQNYDPFGATGHTPRLSVGRTVLNRETWRLPAAELNTERDAIVAWAARQGMPRRVFVHSPLERKPIYVDLDSTVLTRILARMIRRAAANDPREPVTFTEMLPTPDCCWLEDAAGARHTSELRLVCVDTTRRTATCADRG